MYTSDASLISESDSGELTRGSSSGYLTSGPEDEYESGPSEGDGGAMAMASEPDDQLLPVDAAGICSGIPACNPAATLPTGWKRLKKASLLAAAGSQGLLPLPEHVQKVPELVLFLQQWYSEAMSRFEEVRLYGALSPSPLPLPHHTLP